MSKPDGDFAFPPVAYSEAGYEARRGMTLRDYYAAHAISKITVMQNGEVAAGFREYCARVAEAAYNVADAMLAERERAK